MLQVFQGHSDSSVSSFSVKPLEPNTVNADAELGGPLVLSSKEDSEIGSEAETQSLSGYAASLDAESLTS